MLNAGAKINTGLDEITPYTHIPSSSLYFSSNGRGGFGGFDIFESKLEDGVYKYLHCLRKSILPKKTYFICPTEAKNGAIWYSIDLAKPD